MEKLDLICSVIIHIMWFIAGAAIFLRKVSFNPITDTKWGARFAGVMFMFITVVDAYHLWFAN